MEGGAVGHNFETDPPKDLQIRHILIKDHIQIFSSQTAEPNNTKPGRDGPWVGPFQNCVQQPRPPSKITAVTKNRN
jgi:hypothetical protein